MDDIKLTDDERADVNRRIAGLKTEVVKMDLVELKGLAQRIGVPLEKYPERSDLEAAVLLQAEADLIEGVKAIRRADEEEEAMVATADDRRTSADKTILRLHADFAADIPQQARGGATFEPAKDHERFGGEHSVPDGKYRPAGADHIYEFKKKRLVSITPASATNNWGGKDVKSVS